MKSGTDVECRNHFKNGGSTLSKDAFTLKWVELINRLEKNISIGLTNQ